MAKSPSVQFIERDLSTYSEASSETVLAVIGYATKGPIGTPTKVTTFREYNEVFGKIPATPFSYLAVKKAFQQGNQIVFTRVAVQEGDAAASAAIRVINNVSEFVAGTVDLNRDKDIYVGTASYTNSALYGILVNAVPLVIAAPATGSWSLDNVLSQLQSQIVATSGFQEFTNTVLNNSTLTTNHFGFSLGPTFFDGGAGNQDIILEILTTSTVASLIADINEVFAIGTKGYSTGVLAALPEADYQVDIAIDGALPETVTGISLGAGATPATAVAAVNAALVLAGLDDSVTCYLSGAADGSIVFLSSTSGSTSSIAITATVGGTDADFLTLIAGGAMAEVAGATGFGVSYADTVYAEQNEYTRRIRIVNATTGVLSTIVIGTSTLTVSDYITAVTGVPLTTFGGRASIASTLAVTRNYSTRKIVFSNPASVTPPVLADGSSSGVLDLLLILPEGTSTAGSLEVTAENSDKVIITSSELGSANNNIYIIKSTYTNPLSGAVTYKIEVYYNDELKESFTDLSLTETAATFFETVINQSAESGGSSWIHISTIDIDGDGIITFPDGTYNIGAAIEGLTEQAYEVPDHDEIGTYDYKAGTDGISDGSGEDLFLPVLSTAGELANAEIYNYHVLITPDCIVQSVQDAAITLAEFRKDFLYIVDTPFGLTSTQARMWTNGEYLRDEPIISSYAAVYWSWLKDYDTEGLVYVWCPPSVFLGAKLIEVDNNYGPWYAPAGDTRGVLAAQDLEYSPSFPQREDIYGDLNCVNPIVKFPSKGIEIYGQKTGLRTNSALNRVNVRRMVIYIKKLVENALNSLIFEPHNAESWQKATNLVNSILEPIRQDNGLTEYLVVIDSTTNTPDLIAKNIMSGIIKLVPTGTIEIIEISLNVYRAGSTLTE